MPWVSTFGQGSKELQSFTYKANKALRKTPTFNNVNNNKKVIQAVYRKAPCIKQMVSKTNLQVSEVPTTRCRKQGERYVGRRCDACDMMANIALTSLSSQTLKMAGGNCKSSNIIYFGQCSSCNKPYFGKTINSLGSRIAGHRGHLKGIHKAVEIDDNNSLAAHAYFCHNIKSAIEFNKLYKFSVVAHVDPKNLLMNEQHFINRYRPYTPFGLNIQNPVGISAILVT